MLAPVSIGLTLALCASPALPPSNARTLEQANRVLDELGTIPLKGIPTKLLADAQGGAIIPRVLKGGFLVGGRGGHGLVMARSKDGNWEDPVFINLGGSSVGFQAGVESTDVVLIFRSRDSLDRLLMGKGKVTLGADASVAAGPVGRTAAAATDLRLEAEILSYSRGRGVFVGVSVDGATIRADGESTTQFHQPGHETEQKLADDLKRKLSDMGEMGRQKQSPPTVLGPPTHAPIRP